MYAEILPAAKPTQSPWAAKTLTLLVAVCALLATRAAYGQGSQNSLNVGTNLVDLSRLTGNETDPFIAINPANPSNMVVVAATDGTQPGLFITWTTNMGAAWTTNVVATNGDTQGLTAAYEEPSAAFDSFGNLYVAYLPSSFLGVAIAVSTNGGGSFASLTNLAALDVTDTPRITAPRGGAASNSAWVVYKDYTTAGSPLQVQGVLASNLGEFGSFNVVQVVPGSSAGGFPDIAVGPLGHVLVAFQDNLDGTSTNAFALPSANIWVSVQTNSVTNGVLSGNAFMTGNGFSPTNMIATNAIGGVTYLATAPTGIGINASPGLAWDYDHLETNFDKVYLVYTSVGPSGNAVITLLSSTNYGTNIFIPYTDVTNITTNIIVVTNSSNTNIVTTNNVVTTNVAIITNSFWGGSAFVDDDAVSGYQGVFNDHFYPRVAVDPITGIICCSWMDCRQDQAGNSATITNTYSTNITFSSLSLITNVFYTNDIPNSDLVSETNTGTKSITVTIVADNVIGTMFSNDGNSNIYIGSLTNTNFVINLAGTNTGTTKVTVKLEDIFTDAYTSGAGNEEALAYTTISLDGGNTFQRNQQIISGNSTISAPAVGVASSITGTGSATGWGHYTALAAYGANFFPAWPDNSDLTTNNPDGADAKFDIYMLGPGANGSLTVPVADLTIFVTNAPNPVTSEEQITYSVIVTNNGPLAANPVVVTNLLSPFVTLVANSVLPAPGGTFSISVNTNFITNGQQQIVFTWPSLATNGGPMSNGVLTSTFRVAATTSALDTNFATVYSPFLNLFPTNTSNQLVTLVAGEALAMGLTASETNVLIGDTVFSWLTMTNLGPSSNGPVIITNLFSSNWGNVAMQGPGIILVTNTPVGPTQPPGTYLVTNTPAGPMIVANLGYLPVGVPTTVTFTSVALSVNTIGLATFASESTTIWSQDYNTNLSNDGATIDFYVNNEDLGLGMTESTNVLNLGQSVTYTLYVTNFGLSYSGLVTVTNAFSTNLGQFSTTQSEGNSTITNNLVVFNLGTLGAGEIATLTVSAVAVGGPTKGTNIASVFSTDFDLVPANNVVTNLLTVNGEWLSNSISASPTTQQVGLPVTFTEHVTNLGPSANGVVLVTNTFSAKFGSVTVLQPGTNYTINGNVVTFNLGTLNVGQTSTLILTAVPTSTGSGTDVSGVGSAAFTTNTASLASTATVTIIAAQPVISNVVVTPFVTSAFITWTTEFPATAQVLYGTNTSYGFTNFVNATATTNHIAMLTGLTGGTNATGGINYYFEVLSWVGAQLYTNTNYFTLTNSLILGTSDASYTGEWTASSVVSGIYGTYYNFATTTPFNPTSWAVYDPYIPASALYNVYIWYPQNTTFTTNAQVYVYGQTNTLIVPVNETANGGSWQSVASNVYLIKGTNGNVTLYNDTGDTNKYLVANAMMWAYSPTQDYPTNGAVPPWWANFYYGTNVNGYVNGSALAANGYSIYQDYVLGLNPTNAASGLSFTMTQASSNSITTTFSPWQAARSYQLQTTSNLGGAWTTLTNSYTLSTNGVGTFTVTHTNGGSAFYRLSGQVTP